MSKTESIRKFIEESGFTVDSMAEWCQESDGEITLSNSRVSAQVGTSYMSVTVKHTEDNGEPSFEFYPNAKSRAALAADLRKALAEAA